MRRLVLIAVVLGACTESTPTTAPKSPATRARPAAPTTWKPRAPQSVAPVSTVRRTVSTLPPRAARADNSACADCHPDQAESFAKTGMGRSLAKLPGPPVIEDFSQAEKTHGPTGLIYRAYRDAEGRYWQEERHPSHPSVRRIEATHIIGSGNHTRSYLGLIDGELVQLPLTWYSERKIWDFSPGYGGANMPRFSRRVEAPCLFCHNGLTPLAEGRSATYQWPLVEGIGCDRCHGDGQAHVTARLAGKGPPPGQRDDSIFNPKHHSAQRQLQVCQQCHLQADASVVHPGHRWDAYDPRLPLDAYMSVFIKAGDDSFSIASHGRRLAQSKCATQSDQLTCTTCHNPHDTATEATYRAACQSCHGGEKGCSDPAGKAPEARCHTCHMRAGGTSDVPHVEFTDHFIRRRPTADTAKPPRGTQLADMVAGAAPPDAWLLGMAHTFLWERMEDPAHLPEASSALTLAVQQHPTEPRALQALARAYTRQGRRQEADGLFKRAADAGADSEQFQLDRARNLLMARQTVAATAFEALTRRFPSSAAWIGLAQARQMAGDRAGEVAALTEAAKLREGAPLAKSRLAAHAMRARKPDVAKRLLDEARAADPLHVATLIWHATLEMDAGRFTQALPMLDLALQRDGRAKPALAMRGQARAALEQMDGALQDLERLIQLDPNQPNGWVMYIRAAAQGGRKDAARAKLAEAFAKFPNHPGLMGVAPLLR